MPKKKFGTCPPPVSIQFLFEQISKNPETITAAAVKQFGPKTHAVDFSGHVLENHRFLANGELGRKLGRIGRHSYGLMGSHESPGEQQNSCYMATHNHISITRGFMAKENMA